jgi:hypothetical protein
MFEKMVPVNKERHGAKKIKVEGDFKFAAPFHLAYLTVQEFVRAASTYPIVFLEDTSQDAFRPVALLGLEAGKNLFVDEAGVWDANYIPAIVRRYPFALAPSSEADRYLVCVDESSGMLNEKEGVALFDDKGEPSQVMKNVKRYLSELQQMDESTRAFTRFLQENNLLTPLSMRVNATNQVRNITGCYVVNEERLNNFSGEKFLQVRDQRYLPAIFAHLISLAQIERLAKRKEGAPAEAHAPVAEGPADGEVQGTETLQ